MRIGIDATCWTNWRGYGRFTASLVPALLAIDRNNEYVLFFDSGSIGRVEPPAGARAVVVPTARPQVEAASADGRRSLADLLRMTAAVAREPLDLFFSPSVYGYFPLFGDWPKVVTFHDAIAELHPELIFPDGRGRFFWNAKVRLALLQADRIVTVSEHARRDVARTFGLAAETIGVVADAPAEIFRPPASRGEAQREVASRHGIDPPYLLYVGGFGPHKNVGALIDAFAAVSPRFRGASLVLVGERDADVFYSTVADLDRRIERHRLAARARFLGYVPDPDLSTLYQGAAALVLPSIREGYGLPGVEALACGTPVVATRESALPEVVAEAGIFIDPRDGAALAVALETVLGDGAALERMRLAARDRAGLFNWRRSAEQALEIFAGVVRS